ncbi:MAG TPA: S8 family serine peptidase, partial [Kofleriaceae bacterium]|nr:S8 family serine peptidase [Kofleriaceae bacterium]
MGAVFRLEIACEAARIGFALSDDDGRQLAARSVEIAAQPPALWSAVLDTRAWVDQVARTPAEGRERLRELGRYLGEALLGPELLAALGGAAARTLVVRTAGDGPLVAQLRRVPWELARGPAGPSLRERNVVVRHVIGAWPASAPATLALAADEPIRILLVFAEAPGARPLAMRQERELLLEMMFRDVFPHRLVRVNVACHGVTRRRLRELISNAAGFHVLHWSGHGRENALELAAEPGEPPRLTGDELVQLITDAGGFLPQLVFLGACRSAAADDSSTGVAAALLGAGVPQVVAMRYDVGDAHARRLARAFYRHLLVDDAGHPADQALALASRDVALDRASEAESHPVDHETPVVFGGPPLRLAAHRRRSPQLDRRRPRPYPLLASGSKDLDPPDGFVGRGVELSHLYRQWFDAPDAPRVTVLRGLAGLGKTAMAAEMIHLWHGGFDLVLCFQAKGRPLPIDELYGDLDRHLELESASYRERVAQHPSERVYLAPTPRLTGAARTTRMARNLIMAMEAERLLLVLDNFETNLGPKQPGGYPSRDPAWDALLQLLATELPATPCSRAIVTTRNRLAAFAGIADRVITVPLGPLLDGDAMLFVQGIPALHALWISADAARRELALRVMRVSGGHPLLLRCFGGLAAKGAAELAAALDALQRSGYELAPDVLADGVASPALVAYLREVTATALDELIARLDWEARRLLWVLARAEGSVPEPLLAHLWPIARRHDASAVEPAIGELLDTGLVTLQDRVYSTHPLSNERIHTWMVAHAGDAGELTPQHLDGEVGEVFTQLFKALRGEIAAELATTIGRRALRLLARGQRWNRVGTVAGHVGLESYGPLATVLISDLSAIVEGVPDPARWSVRAGLAMALHNANRIPEALAAFERADQEASEQHVDSEPHNHLRHNWAATLALAGADHIEQARALYRAVASAERAQGRITSALITELQAVRLDTDSDPAAALSAIESITAQLRTRSEHDAEAARALDSALNAYSMALFELGRWSEALAAIDAELELARHARHAISSVARVEMYRAMPLVELGRFAEARDAVARGQALYQQVDDEAGMERAQRASAYVERRAAELATAPAPSALPGLSGSRVDASSVPSLAPSSAPSPARMMRAVVHFMDDEERALAQQMMPGAHFAESFCSGEVSAEDLAKLEDAGLVVAMASEPEPLEAPASGAVAGSAPVLESAVRDAGSALESAAEGDGVRALGPIAATDVMRALEDAVRGIAGAPVGARRLGDAPPGTQAKGIAPQAAGPDDAPQIYRLAARGLLLGDGHDALARHGVEVLERMADGAYRVRMSDDAAAGVRGMDFVRGVSRGESSASAPPALPTRRGWPLESLEPREVAEPRRLYTVQVPAEVSAAVLAWLADSGIVVLRRVGERIRIEATEDEIARLQARLDAGSWVEPYEPPRLHCDVARGLVGVEAVGASPLELSGRGELVAIADTGLDAAHPDFADRIERVFARGRPPADASDPHGHGTHVAGTAVGDGAASRGAIRGMAPGARLVFQSLLDADGGLGGIPEPLDALFDEAYQTGARIHLDSWGTASRSTYTLASADVDRYVHAHKDFLVVLSAGNAGSNAANQLRPPAEIEWTTIDAPATCKNAIVVGASRSSRTAGGTADRTYNEAFPGVFPHPPWRDERVSGDPEALAAFSSRGPTDDRRIKPDLVAPGTDILAARSATAPAARFTGTSPDHPRYAFLSGTSMAAPLVAGSAALVREYYRRVRDHAPSAALVKATLINGTRWLSSPCAVAEPGGRPNFHQGFGALRLDTSLPRPGTRERLEFVDGVALAMEEAAWFEADLLGDSELRICLAWTDPPARAVQNNLDLLCRVTAADGKHTRYTG